MAKKFCVKCGKATDKGITYQGKFFCCDKCKKKYMDKKPKVCEFC